MPTTRERVEQAAADLTKACDEVEAGRASASALTPLTAELTRAKAAHTVYALSARQPSPFDSLSVGGTDQPSMLGARETTLDGLAKSVIDAGFNLKSKPSVVIGAIAGLSKANVWPAALDIAPRARSSTKPCGSSRSRSDRRLVGDGIGWAARSSASHVISATCGHSSTRSTSAPTCRSKTSCRPCARSLATSSVAIVVSRCAAAADRSTDARPALLGHDALRCRPVQRVQAEHDRSARRGQRAVPRAQQERRTSSRCRLMVDTRQTRLAKRAAAIGWRLEHGPGGYRLVDAVTGTMVAAAWAANSGYGLDLAAAEAILTDR